MRNTRPSLRALLLLGIALFAAFPAAADALPTITAVSLPNQTAGAAYSAALAVTGGTPPYGNWSLYAGPLPPGLTLNSATGVISGIPTTSGIYGFWVTVSDSAGSISAAQGFVVTIAPAPSVATVALPSGAANTPYTATLAAAGGTLPYTNWTLSSGTLPQGFALNPATGVISGNSTINGYYTFSVTVQDADGVTSSAQTLSIAIGVNITTATLPNWTVNAPYSVQLNAGGGTGAYAGWAVSSGTLPPGLTLNAAGLVSGVPTTTGGYSFTLVAIDSSGAVSTPRSFTLSIALPPVITTTSLSPGVVTVPYNAPLTVTGGTAPASWELVSGTLPAGLSLFSAGTISGIPQNSTANPVNITVQATDAAGVTITQQLSITVNQASLMVAPGSLTFNVNPLIPASVAAQTISVFSNTGPVAFSASFSTSSGGNWLSVSGGGLTPGNLSVSVSTGGLAQNTPYTGQITITGPTLPKAVIVPVTLNVIGPHPPQMSVSPASLTLNYAQGYSVDERYFLVANTGSGEINFSAAVDSGSCGSWLNLLNGTGAATITNPGFVAVQVSPAGLTNQTCMGKITVSSGAQTQTIPVTMTVSALPQSVLLSRTAALFALPYGGTAPPSQTFSVLNAGAGPIDWTLQPQTTSGGDWLSASPASGSSVSGTTPTPVTVSVNPQGLVPGTYYGSILVTAPGAGNGPQSLTAILTVAAETPMQVSPAGVILVGQTSSGTSGTETLTFTNLGGSPLNYTSTVVADNHGNWLVQKPSTGTVAAGGVASMTLQANLAGLPAGVQHAVVRMAFADGTINTVDVYLIVQGTGFNPGCFPNGFVSVFESPEQGFQAIAQTPVPIQLVARDCNTGKLITRSNGLSTQVLIGPQNSAAVELTDDGTGTWTGTWTPAAAVSQVNLTAMVDNYTSATASVVAGQAVVSGSVSAPADGAAGVVTNIVNGVSQMFPGVVTPGFAISLQGAGMGVVAMSADPTAPLPTTLNGTEVLLQGQPLPLSYVDAKQVQAVIPSTVTANERQQLLLVRDGTISAGFDVQVASPQPGVSGR